METITRNRAKKRVLLGALGAGAGSLLCTPAANAQELPTLDNLLDGAIPDAGNITPNTPKPALPTAPVENIAHAIEGAVPSNLLRTNTGNLDAFEQPNVQFAPHVDTTPAPMAQNTVDKAINNYNDPAQQIQKIAQPFLDAMNGHNDPNTIGQAFGAWQLPNANTVDHINKDLSTLGDKITGGEVVNDIQSAIDQTINSPQYEAWRTNTDSILRVDGNLHGVDRAAAGISHLIDTVSTNPARAVMDITNAAGGPVNIILNPINAAVRVATTVLGEDVMRQAATDLGDTVRNIGRAIAEGAPALLTIPAMKYVGEFLGSAPGALAGIIPGALAGMNHGARLGWLLGGPALGIPGAALGWVLGGLPGFILGALPGAGLGAILGGLAPHNIIPGLLTAIPARLLGGLATGSLGLITSLVMALANHLTFPLVGAAGASALALATLATVTYGTWFATVLVPGAIANMLFFGAAGLLVFALGAVITGPAMATPYGLSVISDGILVFLGGSFAGIGVFTLLTAWLPTVIFAALIIPTVLASMTAGGLGGLLLAQISSLIGVPLLTALASIPGKITGTIMGYLLGDGVSRILSTIVGAVLGGLITGIPGAILGKIIGAITVGTVSHILGRILGTLIGGTIGSLLGALAGAVIGSLIGKAIGGLLGLAIGIPTALALWAMISSFAFGSHFSEMLGDPNRLPTMLRNAADRGWRESHLGQLLGTLEHNFYRNTETGNALGDIFNRINNLYHTMTFLDGRRLRDMLLRGGLLGGLIGAVRHAVRDTIPGAILGALILGPLGILPGVLLGRIIGATLGAVPGTILGNLIGGPLGALPAALAGLLNPLNLLNGLIGGIAATIPGAVLGALAGKGLSHLIGLVTAAITGPLSFLPWLTVLNLGWDTLGLIATLIAFSSALVPPLVIATSAWIIVGTIVSSPVWIPGFALASLARATGTIGVGVGAWAALIPELAPFTAAAGTAGTVGNAIAGVVAFINGTAIVLAEALGLVTTFPIAFFASLPFFIFPALAVPTTFLLGKPLMIPIAIGLSALTGLRHGFNADMLSSLINVPLGALLGGALAFPLGAIPAHTISSITRALSYGALGDALGRGIGSSLGALIGATLGQHLGRIPGATLGYIDASILGAIRGALAGAVFGAITGFQRGFTPGAIAALVTHLRANAGSEADGTQWVDGRIVDRGGFGDLLADLPGIGADSPREPSRLAVPNVGMPRIDGSSIGDNYALSDNTALLGV